MPPLIAIGFPDQLANARGVTPAQLAIAYVMAKHPRVIPVIGARTRTQLDEALGARALVLGPDEIGRIEAAVPAAEVAGPRYMQAQMAALDSER